MSFVVALIVLLIIALIVVFLLWKAHSDGYSPMEFLDWASWKWYGVNTKDKKDT